MSKSTSFNTSQDTSAPVSSQNGIPAVVGTLHNRQSSPVYHCAQKKCKGEWNWDGPATEFVRCPLCFSVNCLACQAIHPGVTCAQHVLSIVEKIDKGALQDDHRRAKRLEEHIQVYKQDLVSNAEDFSCSLCLVDVSAGKGIQLKNCHHMLCRQCVLSAIQRSGTVAVKCPYKSGDVYCKMDVSVSEIKALLSPEEYEEYLERSLMEVKIAVKEYFHCRTPKCPWWCFYEPGLAEITCKLCQKVNCMRCDVIHKGESCDKYRASKMQIVLVPRPTPEEYMRVFFICCFHVSYIACIAYFVLKSLFFSTIDVAFPPFEPSEDELE
ncbi:ranBP-type and C3HC4-type zinc finger-containing protein 1-like [Ornithodoros turicata]|uniref:ranBP-type and C3HC4-type zinc finger-containing protein 1-like n=1 Tax=Ornithodoros turicata TaxID=34597 RepID=UPI003138AF7F